MIVPNNVIDLPPPSPPKPKTIVLPPNWKVARDPEGKIYYYHIASRLVRHDVDVVCVWTSRKALHVFLSLHSGKHSGTLQPGTGLATTLVWTMNLRWTWELRPMTRILPRWDLSGDFFLKSTKMVKTAFPHLTMVRNHLFLVWFSERLRLNAKHNYSVCSLR